MTDGAASGTDRRAAAFAVATWLLLLAVVVFGAWWLVFAGWFLEPYAESSGADELSHRVHEVTFGVLFTIALIGVLLQLRRPKENIAAMWQAMITIGAIAIAALAVSRSDWRASLLLGLAAIAALLHPAGRLLWLPRLKPRWPMVVMTLALAIPMAAILEREARKAASNAQGHESHWAMMGVFAVVVFSVALLGALVVKGWRVPAWSAVGAATVYAIVSTRFPFDASARPDDRAFTLVLWAATYGFLTFRAGLDPDRERRSGRLARSLAVGAWVIVGFVLFVGIVSYPSGHQARVPHLVPRTEVASAEYCSTCHNAGVDGATVRPHGVEYLLDSPNGSCSGCHAINPFGIVEVTTMERSSFGAATGFEPIATERLNELAMGVPDG